MSRLTTVIASVLISAMAPESIASTVQRKNVDDVRIASSSSTNSRKNRVSVFQHGDFHRYSVLAQQGETAQDLLPIFKEAGVPGYDDLKDYVTDQLGNFTFQRLTQFSVTYENGQWY